MALGLVTIAFIVLALLNVLELGLLAYVADVFWSPSSVAFCIFNTIWSLLVVAYFLAIPASRPSSSTSSSASASSPSPPSSAAIAFAFFIWIIFTGITAIEGLDAHKNRNSGPAEVAAPKTSPHAAVV
ncbi:unnamed protein product [Parascedosporium putredinis]|uniref:MARVEL domain-containing protein n=1 Tax=Parascedosporium putredinis TaxID=1442378 RepID=A0A9P1H204_9PEZI|nr:unnamed protein product [Parascedosporium putredinis]CAI7994263.1 unnamed protein product [Parascedosporium putredinis]